MKKQNKFLCCATLVLLTSLLCEAQGVQQNLPSAIQKAEEAIDQKFTQPRAKQEAQKQLDAILNSTKSDEDKIRLLNEFANHINGDSRVGSQIDSDGDGIPDSSDPNPLVAADTGLSWNINSVDFSWDLDRQISSDTVQSFQDEIDSLTESDSGYGARINLEAGAWAEAKGGLSSNPLDLFGLGGFNASGGAKVGLNMAGDANYRKTFNERIKNAAQVINKYSQQLRQSKFHLRFTVTFSNASNKDFFINPSPIPIRLDGQQYASAMYVGGQEVIRIPANRDGVDLMFRAEMDSTRAMKLLSNLEGKSLDIDLLRSQMTAKAKDESDGLSRTRELYDKTQPVLLFNQGEAVAAIRVARSNGIRPVTIREALMAVDKAYARDGRLFVFNEGRLLNVGCCSILPNRGLNCVVSHVNQFKPVFMVDFDLPLKSPLIIDCVPPSINDESWLDWMKFRGADESWFSSLAELGDARAQLWLGCFYLEAENYDKAEVWLRKASNKGNLFARLGLGMVLVARKDLESAKPLLTSAADGGISSAQYFLGMLSENPRDAKKWFRLAADQGLAEAQAAYGELLWELDDSAAYDYVMKAVKQGDADGRRVLGLMYLLGTEKTPRDESKAFSYIKMSAEQGDGEAQFICGGMYVAGRVVPRDLNKAMEWYKKSANQGNVEAVVGLGLLYEESGAFKEARSMYEKAIGLGSEIAPFRYSILCKMGLGGAKDLNEVSKYAEQVKGLIEGMEEFALQGLPDHQCLIGLAYLTGVGKPEDKKMARFWFEKASAQGHRDAKVLLEKMK